LFNKAWSRHRAGKCQRRRPEGSLPAVRMRAILAIGGEKSLAIVSATARAFGSPAAETNAGCAGAEGWSRSRGGAPPSLNGVGPLGNDAGIAGRDGAIREILKYIAARGLHGPGIGYVDAHILASSSIDEPGDSGPAIPRWGRGSVGHRSPRRLAGHGRAPRDQDLATARSGRRGSGDVSGACDATKYRYRSPIVLKYRANGSRQRSKS
jgi:hypothetical protein